jgi:hypothetical protein
VLAGLEAALPAFLQACAAGEGARARLAQAALARHAATPAPHAPPRAGTGWLAWSGDIDMQTERVPKR